MESVRAWTQLTGQARAAWLVGRWVFCYSNTLIGALTIFTLSYAAIATVIPAHFFIPINSNIKYSGVLRRSQSRRLPVSPNLNVALYSALAV